MQRNHCALWAKAITPNPDAAVRLICWPYSGGAAALFHPWGKHMPAFVELWAVQLPGHPPRLREPLERRWEPLVDGALSEIQALLDKPSAFFGHSLGAMLAYETARRLDAHGAAMPRLLIASGHAAPHRPRPTEPIHALPDDAFIHEVRRYKGLPDWVLEHREMLEMVLPILRADFEVFETYEHDPEPVLRCPLAVLSGRQDPWTPEEDLEAWGELTSGPVQYHAFAGEHFFLHDQQQAVLWTVSRLVEALCR